MDRSIITTRDTVPYLRCIGILAEAQNISAGINLSSIRFLALGTHFAISLLSHMGFFFGHWGSLSLASYYTFNMELGWRCLESG